MDRSHPRSIISNARGDIKGDTCMQDSQTVYKTLQVAGNRPHYTLLEVYNFANSSVQIVV
eukprot:scaffold8_cov15-Prasinocladus_malaysianus.AAC.2